MLRMHEARRARRRALGWGAGATLAREGRACTQRKPAASGVMAHGWWKRAPRRRKPQEMGGREVAALFLRISSAGLVLSLCKNSDATRGPQFYAWWIAPRASELRGVAIAD